MAKRALILIEGSRGNGSLYVQAAQRLGLHPITLAADPAQYDYLAAENSESIRVDTADLDALIHKCSQLGATYDIVGITGFTGLDESGYVTIVKLCQHFGLPGPNLAAIEQCSDKYTQRKLLAAAGIPIPAYRLAANATEVESAAAEIGLPVIVKPAEGSGSTGVRLCRDADEVAEHTKYLLSGAHVWRSSPRILVEEFAQGSFYSADAMGNTVIAVGASDFNRPPHFVPCESMFPAPLTDEEYIIIADVSLSCLRALGLGWGPANIEFRWTKRGPVVIEVNARLPGWTTPRLIHLAYGVDLVTEHIKLIIGEECNLRARHSHTAAARFLVADRNGTLDRIEGTNLAAAVPGVVDVRFYVEPKAPIVRKGDYRDMIGHVIAASPSGTQTKAILQRAVDLISWSITPFPTLHE
ncbi:ATP-grasp domain-containing protein [Sinorhizobium medicae]|uniref:ATP-grasp domain-containing protein n=1 Tax=Sinorhizobium medicae TaxID=110321 RepID=UPI000FDB5FF6|nr:acetyl-CoA carboxylase biotin carboxylase subunit family protein [Sinorhizobium medicae]RVP44654.1 ATP-grasp domain-containing protein [Sinorhizobium medicae]RVP68210.1 ATP-grasp domain-containing protein [Sinorhizobium medicae]UWU12359.1 acetyl-CoA carboxylase biotin carboxylase subunit family protein [Sinorhizobium medicae]